MSKKVKRYYLVDEEWINNFIQTNEKKVWAANESQIQLLKNIKQQFEIVEIKK